MHYLIMTYSFTDYISEKETLKERLQELDYNRNGQEGIRLNYDSQASEGGKRQIRLDIHGICLMFRDFSVKYTARCCQHLKG